MPDAKISQLTALTTAVSADLLPIVDTTANPDETKKITLGNTISSGLATITGLSAATSLTTDDLIPVVDDPAGTPAAKKITYQNFLNSVTALTATTTPTSDDLLLLIDDPAGTPTAKKVTLANLQSTVSKVVQVVNTTTGAVATGTTTIPADDTIPQNTEGTEFMTLAITPTSSTNKLRIDVVWIGTVATSARTLCIALFQDSTANALAVGVQRVDTASCMQTVGFTHYMTSGTTSSTTFKVRAGVETSGTLTFNGAAGGRLWGGVLASSITITEVVP